MSFITISILNSSLYINNNQDNECSSKILNFKLFFFIYLILFALSLSYHIYVVLGFPFREKQKLITNETFRFRDVCILTKGTKNISSESLLIQCLSHSCHLFINNILNYSLVFTSLVDSQDKDNDSSQSRINTFYLFWVFERVLKVGDLWAACSIYRQLKIFAGQSSLTNSYCRLILILLSVLAFSHLCVCVHTYID